MNPPERAVCSEDRGGRRHGRPSRECLSHQVFLSLLSRAQDDIVITAVKVWCNDAVQKLYTVRIILHTLVRDDSKQGYIIIWHMCCALLILSPSFSPSISIFVLLHCCSTVYLSPPWLCWHSPRLPSVSIESNLWICFNSSTFSHIPIQLLIFKDVDVPLWNFCPSSRSFLFLTLSELQVRHHSYQHLLTNGVVCLRWL